MRNILICQESPNPGKKNHAKNLTLSLNCTLWPNVIKQSGNIKTKWGFEICFFFFCQKWIQFLKYCFLFTLYRNWRNFHSSTENVSFQIKLIRKSPQTHKGHIKLHYQNYELGPSSGNRNITCSKEWICIGTYIHVQIFTYINMQMCTQMHISNLKNYLCGDKNRFCGALFYYCRGNMDLPQIYIFLSFFVWQEKIWYRILFHLFYNKVGIESYFCSEQLPKHLGSTPANSEFCLFAVSVASSFSIMAAFRSGVTPCCLVRCFVRQTGKSRGDSHHFSNPLNPVSPVWSFVSKSWAQFFKLGRKLRLSDANPLAG